MSRSDPAPTTERKRLRGPTVPKEATRGGQIAAVLVYGAVCAIDASLRYTWTVHRTAEERLRSGPVIFAIWHNRLALSLRLYQRLCKRYRQTGRWTSTAPRMAAIVSASRDGGLLSCVLRHFGVQPVRGSSSRRGPQALLELTSWAERGYDLAVTPDGPRGPREVVQEGVVALAQLTGLPILPASYCARWQYVVKSWDQFRVPMPFSRCAAEVGEMLQIERNASDAERQAVRTELERRLRAMSEEP